VAKIINNKLHLSILTIAFLIIVVLLIVYEEENTVKEGDIKGFSIQNIQPDKASKKAQDENVKLIDIRTKSEREKSHIPDSKHIQEKETLEELDRNYTYILYCQSGNRSSGTVKFLYNNGFRDIYNLKGGIQAWEEEGLKTY